MTQPPRDPFAAMIHGLESVDPSTPGRYRLDRIHSGELVGPEAVAIRALAQHDPAMRETFAALAAEDAQFSQELPWDAVKGSILSRAQALADEVPAPLPSARWGSLPASSWLRFLVPLASAAVVLVLLVSAPAPGPNSASRIKGDRLAAWARIEGHTEPIEAGATLRAGDQLQFRVTTTQDHLVLLGVDGTGTVSRYLPLAGEQALPWSPGVGVAMPSALVLDDAPGPEVFLALFLADPVAVDDLEHAVSDVVARGGARAILDHDWSDVAPESDSFWIEKEGPVPVHDGGAPRP